MFQFVIHFCTDDISRCRIVKMVVYINKALEIKHCNRFNHIVHIKLILIRMKLTHSLRVQCAVSVGAGGVSLN